MGNSKIQFEARCILQPYCREEAMSVSNAARNADASCETIRRWIPIHGIGRKIVGTYKVSRVALVMLLDGNRSALAAYHQGDRQSRAVASYFKRLNVPLMANPPGPNQPHRPRSQGGLGTDRARCKARQPRSVGES